MYPIESTVHKNNVFSFDINNDIQNEDNVLKDPSGSIPDLEDMREITNKKINAKDEATEEKKEVLDKECKDLKDVEKLVAECSSLLRISQEKNVLQESSDIIENMTKVEFGLDLLRQQLLSSAYFLLSSEEYSAILDESEHAPDPSVEFFGLEWTSVFKRLYQLGLEIRLLKIGLEQNRLCSDRLVTCLSLIHQLTAETQMHIRALDTGRLSSSNLSLQLKQQTVAQCARTSSFHNKSGNSKRGTKYKGSKTDTSLVIKQENNNNNTQNEDNKKSSKSSRRVSKSGRRKSSLIESFSNIFTVLKM